MKRIVLITNIAAPYRIYHFNHMYRELQKYDIELNVVFYEAMNKVREWSVDRESMEFPYRIFNSSGIGDSYRVAYFNPDVIHYAVSLKPDLTILSSCWYYPDYIPLYMNMHKRKKLLMWTEINESKLRDPVIIRRMRDWVFRKPSVMLIPGISSERYLRKAGFKGRLIYMPNLINEDFFTAPSELRPEIRNILLIARMIRIKQVPETLETILQTAGKLKRDINVTVIGNGVEAELTDRIAQNSSNVTYHRTVPYEHINKYYSTSDLFILNSTYDPSPLSIIEAIRTGNAVICSNVAGNANDVIEEGANGYTVNPNNKEALSNKLERIMLWDKDTVANAKKKSLEIYENRFSVRSVIGRVAADLADIIISS